MVFYVHIRNTLPRYWVDNQDYIKKNLKTAVSKIPPKFFLAEPLNNYPP